MLDADPGRVGGCTSPATAGALPMPNALTRLQSRFLADPAQVDKVMARGAEGKITTLEADDLGLVTIYRERNLLPDLSVAENILLVDVPVNRIGVVQWKTLYSRAGGILERRNFALTTRTLVNRRSIF